jgi:signal transduction histidine kinase
LAPSGPVSPAQVPGHGLRQTGCEDIAATAAERPSPGVAMDPESSHDLLVRSVAYELRQDLSVIVGYAELLATRQLPETERTSMIAAVREAAANIADVLHRLDCPEQPGRIRLGPEELLDLRSPGGRSRR